MQTDGHSPDPAHTHHDHADDHERGHRHTHGIVDPEVTSSARGIWAVKWSFIGLVFTAAVQIVVVVLSGVSGF